MLTGACAINIMYLCYNCNQATGTVSLGFWIATNRGLITSGKHYSQMRFGERRQMHLSNPPPHPALHSTSFRHRTVRPKGGEAELYIVRWCPR